MRDAPAVAYARIASNRKQPLEDHLKAAAALAAGYAEKIRLPLLGELLGLLHDLGKYSSAFQTYLHDAQETPDEGTYDPGAQKGTIDHSTAAGQFVWNELSGNGSIDAVLAQVISLCLVSHHSGLIDCLHPSLSSSVKDAFSLRMAKPDDQTHRQEALSKAESDILDRARELLAAPELTASFERIVRDIVVLSPGKSDKDIVAQNQLALLIRFLFSCLIDADRSDSARFAYKERMQSSPRTGMDWEPLIHRLENHLGTFENKTPVDDIRKAISDECRDAASRGKGIRTLTVPTGGGKTLAGLRFAMHHAKMHGMERVISFIPFTSIIDQNADVARKILEPEGVPSGSIVLEHHSNLTPELQPSRSKFMAENWDAPIIYTTLVQFLDVVFGHGTRGVRRMHRLANSVLIFDEIQSLPVNCIHLFNNAVNFLAEQCGCTIVLCTATQPLLHRVNPTLGAARLAKESEIVTDVPSVFNALKRVEIRDGRVPGGSSLDEVAELAGSEVAETGSCLVVVNTKKSARDLYRAYKPVHGEEAYHLSTSMCPAHRKEVLRNVKDRLANGRATACFSTQLIEAGVDIDFASVIRSQAGLDSLAQSAGRCNRNGSMASPGRVHIVRLQGENLTMLPDIRQGRDKADRVLDEFSSNPAQFGNDCIGPKAMEWYYDNYFFSRADEMAYPIGAADLGHADTLLNILSGNTLALEEFKRANNRYPDIYFRQSFMTAGKIFEPISSLARGVIIPYGKDGERLLQRLRENTGAPVPHGLLRSAQQYSVNVFPHHLNELMGNGVIREVLPDTGILFLADSRYYSPDFGLSQQPEA